MYICNLAGFKFSMLLQAMAASANPILADKSQRDPILFCSGYKRQRFYMFTRSEPEYAHSLPTLLSSSDGSIQGTNLAIAIYLTSALRAKNSQLQQQQLGTSSVRLLLLMRPQFIPRWVISIYASFHNKHQKLLKTSLDMQEVVISRVSFSIVSYPNL